MAEHERVRAKLVPAAVYSVDEALEKLSEAIDGLANSLVSVLRPVSPPSPEPATTEQEPQCDLEGRIVNLQKQIEVLKERILDLTIRLEL